MRLVDRVAVQIDLALHRPVAAPQLGQDVAAEAAPQERLLGLVLLADLPRMRRGLGAVFRCGERVGVVGDSLVRRSVQAGARRAARASTAAAVCTSANALREIDVAVARASPPRRRAGSPDDERHRGALARTRGRFRRRLCPRFVDQLLQVGQLGHRTGPSPAGRCNVRLRSWKSVSDLRYSPSRYASASSAAMQPVPADVTAWR